MWPCYGVHIAVHGTSCLCTLSASALEIFLWRLYTQGSLHSIDLKVKNQNAYSSTSIQVEYAKKGRQHFVHEQYANLFHKHNNEHNVQGAMLWQQKIKSINPANAGMALADKIHKQVYWLVKQGKIGVYGEISHNKATFT